jgi:hypothetical protein
MPFRVAQVALAAIVFAARVMAAEVTIPVPGDGRGVSTGGPWVIHVADAPDGSTGRLAFMLGTTDITGLLRRDQSGRYTYAAELQPLPAGRHDLKVYVVRDRSTWEEIAKVPVVVLAAGGFEEASWDPRVELHEKSQFDETVRGDTAASPRTTYYDLAGQAGLASRHRRGEFELRTSWNVVGSTNVEEALRYAQKGTDAPQLDLSDYLVEMQSARQSLSIGHVNFGSQPLLYTELANRGLAYKLRPAQQLQVGLTVQNAQRITGYNHLLGVHSTDNYLAALAVGYDLLKTRPGGLGVEFTLLDAESVSELDFNAGEVPDAEKSRGYGVRIRGSSPDGRLRATLDHAWSSYTNPSDPTLSQGADIVPVEESSDRARAVDLSYDLLRDKTVHGDLRASVTLGFRHDRADPLYRSIGGGVTSGIEANALMLSCLVGEVSFQAQSRRSTDNLDDIPTLLTTQTDATVLSISLPLQSMIDSDGTPRWWWPQGLSHSYGYTHQRGIDEPLGLDPQTHIADQVTRIQNFNVSWAIGLVSVGYTLSIGDQDNRQPARALADFENVDHGLQLVLPVRDVATVFLGATLSDARDIEQDISRWSDSYSFGFDWRLSDRWNLRGNYTWSATDDSRDLASSDGETYDTALSWRFELPGRWLRKVPGQVFLRHAAQQNDLRDSQFGITANGSSWAIRGGVTLGLP